MSELFRVIYNTFYESPTETELNQEIECCHQKLIETLDRTSRNMVLQIIDDKDQIRENTSFDSFIAGFALAYQLSREIAVYRQHNSFGDPDEY